MTYKLKEDTVSADRKERIIFDPDAWRKSDKSGKKTSSITSRQNFDNEKFTRKAEKQVDEGTIQPSGDSKVDSAGPTQSDTISQDKQVKKSNNPQIEFVTGTATPNGSSSTAIGGARAMGRKLAEELAQKALTNIKRDIGLEEACKDEKKKPKKVSEEVEHLDEKDTRTDEFKYTSTSRPAPSKEFKPANTSHPAPGKGFKFTGTSRPAPSKEFKPANTSHSTSSEVSKHMGTSHPSAKPKLNKEETNMSKTYTEFMEELDQLVEFVVEENQLNEYNAKDGVYRHKGTYGGGYVDPEGADDADDKPKAAPAPAVKRGRGNPGKPRGSYKARSAETKAAAAAKSAASKAANKAKQ